MVVLAAGRATRFGATKQLAELDGRPLVAHAVAAATAAAVGPVLVVVGHDGDAVAQAARAAGSPRIVANPDHASGQGSSLRAGLQAAADLAVDGVVVLLADEPEVPVAAVRSVATRLGADAPVVRARYADGDGHPVGLHRSIFVDAVAAGGDQGARGLLAHATPVPVAGTRPRDVDHPEDLTTRPGGSCGDAVT